MKKKPLTTEEQIAAELAALKAEDAKRGERVARIEALQVPIVEQCLEIMRTLPMAEAVPLLAEKAPHLTDNRQVVVVNMVAHADHAYAFLTEDLARLTASPADEGQAEAA